MKNPDLGQEYRSIVSYSIEYLCALSVMPQLPILIKGYTLILGINHLQLVPSHKYISFLVQTSCYLTVCISSRGLHGSVPAVKYVSNPALFYMKSVWTDTTANLQRSCFYQHILQRTKLSHTLHRNLLQVCTALSGEIVPTIICHTLSQ